MERCFPVENKGKVTITPYENGPLIVRGNFEIETADGNAVPKGRRIVALCRCGVSSIKPFCDGTHKLVGFKAEGDASA
jgi:CDGSH-type Zn-finger protein